MFGFGQTFEVGEAVWWDDPDIRHAGYYTVQDVLENGYYRLSRGHVAYEDELTSEEDPDE